MGGLMPNAPSRATAAILLVTACLTIMVGCVIVPALSQTVAGLGVKGATWLVTLPSLGVILGSPAAGWLIARLGAWRVLAAGLLAYALLGAGGALLHGPWPVYADRLILGMATAAVMASGTTLIALFWPAPQARLRMIAAQGMAIELGGVIFLAIGGWLATRDWHAPFLLYLLAAAVLGAQLLAMPRPAAPSPSPSSSSGATARRPLGLYVRAAGTMTIFFIAILNLPMRLAALGLDATGSGLFLAFVSLVAVGAASGLPRILARAGTRRTFMTAFACYGLAHGLFALDAPLDLCVVGGVLLGTGFGLSVPLVNHCVIEKAPAHALGPWLSMLSLTLFLGQFLASFAALLPGPATLPFILAAAGALLAALLHLRRAS
jgi:hypothetical protein